MTEADRPILLRDSTLREALDTPGVAFSTVQKLRIAEALARAGVAEAEVVAPARVLEDLAFARELKRSGISLRASGLIYANGPAWRSELDRASEWLDRVELLMPLSERREPRGRPEKIARLVEVLTQCRAGPIEVGVGFPHATQVVADFPLEIAASAVAAGAGRVTLYDTNGSAEPFGVHGLVARLSKVPGAALFFHAHNDLGLATANAWAAVSGGASGLDVTVNGLGDRAGNASLEQVALLLHVRGRRTGIELHALKDLSRLVESLSGVPLSRLAPVVGDYAFDHRSPSHLSVPAEFEAFDPGLIGGRRR